MKVMLWVARQGYVIDINAPPQRQSITSPETGVKSSREWRRWSFNSLAVKLNKVWLQTVEQVITGMQAPAREFNLLHILVAPIPPCALITDHHELLTVKCKPGNLCTWASPL
jgi:hypothetical protein